MPQRAIRFSETTDKGIQEADEKRGFSSPTALIRHAREQELSGHKEELASAEHKLGPHASSRSSRAVTIGAVLTLVELGQGYANGYSRAARRREGRSRC